MNGSALVRAGLSRSSARLGSVLTSVRYALPGSKYIDQLGSELGSAWIGIRLNSARGPIRLGSVRLSGVGSTRLEAELILARCLARRSSRIGSAKLRYRSGPAQTKTRGSILGSALFEARICIWARGSALCSTLSSALLNSKTPRRIRSSARPRFGAGLEVRLGARLEASLEAQDSAWLCSDSARLRNWLDAHSAWARLGTQLV